MIYDVRRLHRRLRGQAWTAARELPATPEVDALRAALLADDYRYAASAGYKDPRVFSQAARLARLVLDQAPPPSPAFEPLAAAKCRLPEMFDPALIEPLLELGRASLRDADAPVAAARAWWLHQLDPEGGWARLAHTILESERHSTGDVRALLRVALVGSELYCPSALHHVERQCDRFARADRLTHGEPTLAADWSLSLLLDYMSRQTRHGRYVTAAWHYAGRALASPPPPAPLTGLWLAFLTDRLRTPRPGPPARPLVRGA